MSNQEKLKELLKEIRKVKFFEQIKSTKDYGLLVDILQNILGRINLAKGEQGIRGEKGSKGDKGERGEIGKSGKDGRDGRDGKNANETIIIKEVLKEIPIPKDGINSADGSPDTPEVIVSKLESLEDEDKLKISAIKNLEEELEKLKKQVSQRQIIGGAGPTGGHIVKAYDISDSLDGQTKTFSLPAFWRIISIVSSSFPTAFRLTTDYTVDGSNFKITFTSEIDAGTTLAAGQTIIVTYSE